MLIGTLGPVLTIVFAWMLLSEPVSFAQFAGAGLVLAGVLLVSRRKSSPVQPGPAAAPRAQDAKPA
ncbi:EamA family transporter [Pseudomonas sp. EA_105y_Pfl2_R69]|uniref:EamA family transporter n=1 Tax=Pseudomonas sp. EA_105y_Pfl2_R69 TaxID=3088683 RepID=UPI00403F610F